MALSDSAAASKISNFLEKTNVKVYVDSYRFGLGYADGNAQAVKRDSRMQHV